jgi:ribosomal protein L40E
MLDTIQKRSVGEIVKQFNICLHCGAGIDFEDKTCKQCGAPNENYKAHEIRERVCTCGLVITNQIELYRIPDIVCHRCFKTFDGSFTAQYNSDKIYPNGQMTHLYLTAGLECPHCHTVFNGHEFYHGVYQQDGVENLLDHAKAAQLIG